MKWQPPRDAQASHQKADSEIRRKVAKRTGKSKVWVGEEKPVLSIERRPMTHLSQRMTCTLGLRTGRNLPFRAAQREERSPCSHALGASGAQAASGPLFRVRTLPPEAARAEPPRCADPGWRGQEEACGAVSGESPLSSNGPTLEAGKTVGVLRRSRALLVRSPWTGVTSSWRMNSF